MMAKENDILLLENPFPVGSGEHLFVEDYVLNFNEVGPGAIDELKRRASLIDFDKVKEWLLSSMSYYCFLRISLWKICSAEVMRRNKFRCQRCGSGRALSVHHSGFIQRGNEPFELDKLECLCGRCHIKGEHGRDVILSKGQRRKLKELGEEEIEDFVFGKLPAEGKVSVDGLADECGMDRGELEGVLLSLQVKCRVNVVGGRVWRREEPHQ